MADVGRVGKGGLLTGVRIGTRLWIIVAAAVVGIIALGLLSARDARSSLQAERELKTQHLVQAASGVLAHFQELEAKGALTRAAAQSQAAEVLRVMRYGSGGREYFWINDAQGHFVMHPTKPELQGADKIDMTDPNGVPIMRRFIAASAGGKGGFVAYSWPPASDPKGTPEPKTSYVQGFAPWGWTVGSGIYTSDVSAAFWGRLKAMSVWAALVLAVVAGLALLLGRGIVTQLRAMRDAMTRIGESGDLRARVPVSADEIGEVGGAFNRMLDSFGGVIRKVGEGARTLSATAGDMGQTAAGSGVAVAEIAATIQAVSTAAGEQAQSTAQATESVVGIAADVQQVASRGRGAAEAAQQADTAARDGMDTLEEARRVMAQIDATVSAAADVVREVGARGAEVGQIVDVITDIAGQTNLLALNAAIEAARAGEHGRGFSVVAEEVRALAEQCATAAESIARIVQDMRSGTERAVEAIGVGRGAVDDGTATMRAVADAFASIRQGVARVTAEVDGVAEAAGTLERDAAAVQDAMSTIAAISQENAAVTQQLAAPTETVELVRSTAGRVGELARDLDGLVTGFKVD